MLRMCEVHRGRNGPESRTARAQPRRGAAGRVKQLLQHWTAGGLCDEDRASWLTESEPERLFARLAEVAGGARDPALNPMLDPRLDRVLEAELHSGRKWALDSTLVSGRAPSTMLAARELRAADATAHSSFAPPACELEAAQITDVRSARERP